MRTETELEEFSARLPERQARGSAGLRTVAKEGARGGRRDWQLTGEIESTSIRETRRVTQFSNFMVTKVEEGHKKGRVEVLRVKKKTPRNN